MPVLCKKQERILPCKTTDAANIGRLGYVEPLTVKRLAGENGVKRIGFEEDYLTYRIWKAFEKDVDAELVYSIALFPGIP